MAFEDSLRHRPGAGIAVLRAARIATLVGTLVFGALTSTAIGQSPKIVMPTIGGVGWGADDLAKLTTDLDAEIVGTPALRGAHVGVLAKDTRSGDVLYARNVDDEFQPASTLKLLVGSVALEKLGPGYRFETSAYERSHGAGPVSVVNQRLIGDLVLRGGGDPFLTADDLQSFADSVKASGIRSVVGFVVDATRFDDRPYPAGWTSDDISQSYAPVVSAMTVEKNVLRVRVVPRAGGVDLLAQVLPKDAGFFLEHCGPTLDPLVEPMVSIGPSGTENTLDTVRERTGCTNIVGNIAMDSLPSDLEFAVPSPTVYAYRIATMKLAGRGIDPGSYFSHEAEPWTFTTIVPMKTGAPVLWRHESAPLESWLGSRFWIPSDNLTAELVLKEIGYRTGGDPGTTDKGIAYERSWLQSIGIDPATTTLADGSGLSQYDRITPRDLVAILQYDWNGPNRQLVLDSLPVGGARGTIEGIAGTPAAGRVFAKTGSMSHVRGLAGYLATQRHGAVTFAFNVDDWNGDYASLAALRARVLSRIVSD